MGLTVIIVNMCFQILHQVTLSFIPANEEESIKSRMFMRQNQSKIANTS